MCTKNNFEITEQPVLYTLPLTHIYMYQAAADSKEHKLILEPLDLLVNVQFHSLKLT